MLIERPQRRPWLKQALIGTPWRGDLHVRTPRQKENLECEEQAWLLCWHILRTLSLLLGVDEWHQENKRVRHFKVQTQVHHNSFNHNRRCYCEFIPVTHQWTAWKYPPPLVKSGIDHLRALTDIFNATKEGYNDREEKQATNTTAHSPRLLRGSPPPRVAKDKNLQDLVHTGTTDDNDKRDTPARNTCSQSNSLSIMDKIMLSCCQMSRTSYQIDPQKSASRKYPLQLFCKFAGEVLDEETGDLL